MALAADRFKSFLENKSIRYDYYEPTEKRNEAVKVTYKGDNADKVSVIFFFDKDGKSVNVKSFSIAKIPSNKLMDMYVALNELNCEYRWVKFYVDSDNEVTVSGDAIINADSVGAECHELLVRYVDIIDKVYPRLMKVLWS
ncbi:MAG: YbjN domain-containing protein [Ruminococcaceae bacterium]|nr:YbjN domain-containing protein [Oscillospiraceae bacterium]